MAIKIIPATIEDEDRVLEFLQKYFYPDEPLNAVLKRPIPKNKNECPPMSMLQENLSLLAVESDNPDKICGMFLNKTLDNKPKENLENLEKQHEGTKYGKILKFLNYTDAKFLDVMSVLWDETNTNIALDASVIAVRSDCRRQHIGTQLMAQTVEVAKNNKIKWITIRCTSAFSAALAEKSGFSETYYLPYSDYKDEDGEIVFNIEKHHHGFRAYTKYLQD